MSPNKTTKILKLLIVKINADFDRVKLNLTITPIKKSQIFKINDMNGKISEVSVPTIKTMKATVEIGIETKLLRIDTGEY